jgi:hypothetical protein
MAPAPTVSVPADLRHHTVLPHEELLDPSVVVTDKMNNSGKLDDPSAASSTTTAAAPAMPDLKTLSMTLPTRRVNDHVEDTEKIKKMAEAVRVLLEVRSPRGLYVPILLTQYMLTMVRCVSVNYSALART